MALLKKLVQSSLFIITLHAAYADESAEISQKQEALSTHNQFRAIHHAPPLIWDDTLANYAKHYASQCVFKHSHSPYGENLAAGYPTISAGINAWYAEQKKYSYFWPGFSYKTGHFTQVVWKSTERLGCAFVLCDGKNSKNGRPWHYLVCEYNPPGNMNSMSYFRENVLPE
jgi:pathogenesis-related protein 1